MKYQWIKNSSFFCLYKLKFTKNNKRNNVMKISEKSILYEFNVEGISNIKADFEAFQQ